MAITTNNTTGINPWSVTGPVGASWVPANNTTTTMDHLIQGQMYTTEYTISNVQIQYMATPFNPDEIKTKLTYQIAEELLKSNAIEFTKLENLHDDTRTFRARIYAVPDNMVRILRENGK